MKKIILLFLLLLFENPCFAQIRFTGNVVSTGIKAHRVKEIDFQGDSDADNYSALVSQTDVIVYDPPGAGTNAFNHHAKLTQFNGDLYLIHTTHQSGEDLPGMFVRYSKSTDNGSTWSAPVEVFESMSEPSDSEIDSRIVSSYRWAKYNGVLYAIGYVSLIDFPSEARTFTGLIARSIASNGDLGTPFWIYPTPAPTPFWTEPTWSFDSTLSQPLLDSISDPDIWTTIGTRSQPNYTTPSFTSGSRTFNEGSQYKLDGWYMRLWRCSGGCSDADKDYKWVQYSIDGSNWSDVKISNVIDSPSWTVMGRLSNGRYWIIGNDQNSARDVLFFCQSSDGITYADADCYKIRHGITNTPEHTGRNKGGGAAYPWAVENSNGDLTVCYSTQKEEIVCTTFTPPSLN